MLAITVTIETRVSPRKADKGGDGSHEKTCAEFSTFQALPPPDTKTLALDRRRTSGGQLPIQEYFPCTRTVRGPDLRPALQSAREVLARHSPVKRNSAGNHISFRVSIADLEIDIVSRGVHDEVQGIGRPEAANRSNIAVH